MIFGKNASGKTALLESLASILDPKFEWLGRRARIGDANFAFGTLYLSGDWDGDDWAWLRSVMADQDSEIAANAAEPVANVWEWPTYGQRSTFVREAAQHFADSSDPDSAQTLAKILDLLTKDMLVTYLPFPHGPVDAVIDTAMLGDDTRSWILESSRLLGGSSLAPSLVEIGASPQRYVRLMGLGFLDEEIFDDHALHPPTVLNISAGVVDAEAMLAATIFGSRAAKIHDESHWLSPSEDGRYVTNPDAITAAAKVAEILQAGPLPAFILEQGLPEIRIPTPELWAQTGRVNLGLRTAEDRFLDIRQTSAATRRWLEILSVLAVDTLLRADLKNDESLTWVQDSQRFPTASHARYGVASYFSTNPNSIFTRLLSNKLAIG